jgi:hypothetical protein
MLFIVTPRFGLCNQLQSLCNAILIANQFNRNLYIYKFQKSWDGNINNNLCEINEVLDIEKLNIILNNLNIKIKIISNIDNNIINLSNYIEGDFGEISLCKDIIKYINLENNINKCNLIIGNIVNHEFNNDYEIDLLNKIIVNLPFKQIFYDCANIIKNELNLDSHYQSCHLRIEDDAILCFSKIFNISEKEYNNSLLNFYYKNIESCNKLYICSGLELPNNMITNISYTAKKLDIPIYKTHANYEYYKKLINKNSFIMTKKKNYNEFIGDNRELNAILDLIIAYDSLYFIGSGISSFSILISNYFRLNNKKFILHKV